ncbi:streptomycin biosynthesis regulator [Kitasatospora sp. NPDC057223]|uniref:ParB/RepB/Spo0J family partition protein n=1 Tax=Kitasatospora sp. NPDC057223 TaxID=3346055 RepID=UPI00363AFFD4
MDTVQADTMPASGHDAGRPREAEDQSVQRVPIGMLLPADSPRMSGENLDHARALGALDGDLPPILVHRSTMRVIDGMHRLRAAILQEQALVDVLFFDGTPEDAFVVAVRSNCRHGLPLTLAERAAAAARIMISHPQWSDRAIASVAGLSSKTVAALRRRTGAGNLAPQSRVGQDGRVRPLDSTAGRLAASQLIAATPEASLREIARQAGISPGTVRDVRARLDRGEDPLPQAHRRRSAAARQRRARPREDAAKAPDPAAGPPADLGRVFTSLRNDPSLRQTEAGRLLLRMLEMHLPHQWDRLAESVPAYRAGTVALAAVECAKAWQEFAARMRRDQPP